MKKLTVLVLIPLFLSLTPISERPEPVYILPSEIGFDVYDSKGNSYLSTR
jgi:hypothetical protein